MMLKKRKEKKEKKLQQQMNNINAYMQCITHVRFKFFSLSSYMFSSTCMSGLYRVFLVSLHGDKCNIDVGGRSE